MNGSRKLAMVALIVLIALVPLAVLPALGLAVTVPKLIAWLSSAGLAVGMAAGLGDKLLTVTKALPNGATTVATDGIDLELTSQANFVGQCELEIAAPALVVGDLADTETMTYDIYHDDAVGFGTEALLAGSVIVQTGSGGAGAAAVTQGYRFPSNVKRYVRVKATNSGAGDASDKSMTVQIKVPHSR